ncbi:hypothetical protein [Qipengyuania spongiae]|uniref:Uncharacterized protein n=1 Tax=Qipengyuania spongiae TaxID=2909673 RepID=A0ABY5T2K2_9SPHN|nr:hypothetical protein [Qipengyuania spongiae]UVI40655.1 hypothetical protein L1F33_06880 [Qipengyuania spongiae]
MPLVLELIVLMLAAYAAGLGIGWLIWGSSAGHEDHADSGTADDHD